MLAHIVTGDSRPPISHHHEQSLLERDDFAAAPSPPSPHSTDGDSSGGGAAAGGSAQPKPVRKQLQVRPPFFFDATAAYCSCHVTLSSGVAAQVVAMKCTLRLGDECLCVISDMCEIKLPQVAGGLPWSPPCSSDISAFIF